MEIVKDNNSLQSLQNTPSIFTQELQDLINSTRKKLNEQLPKYHPSTLTDEHIFWFLLNDKYNIDNSIKFILKYLEWRNKYSNGQPIQTFEIINEINDNKSIRRTRCNSSSHFSKQMLDYSSAVSCLQGPEVNISIYQYIKL